jgi:imidazolonepropionase-like amidohydrolase
VADDAEDLAGALTSAVAEATEGAWEVSRAYQERGSLFLVVEGAEPPLILEIRTADPDTKAYRVLHGLAFSYRADGELAPAHRPRLDAAVPALATVLTRHGFDPARDDLRAEADEPAAFPTPFHVAYFEGAPPPLPEDTVEAYRRDGHVLVRRALRPDVLFSARRCAHEALARAWPHHLPPVEERPDAYSRSFTQITDLGLDDARLRVLTHAPRIAAMAAQLMGVPAVRLFCEDWLIKEPGALITPWHQDAAVFPFDAEATITCWIPLQNVPEGLGLLRFARGSHRHGLAPVENISDESEERFAALIEERGLAVDRLPPVFLGDVSFHDGRTVHGAFCNGGEEPRVVLALHCFADGARLKAPSTPTMAEVLRHAVPGGAPGEPAVSARWPLLHDVRGPGPRVRIEGREAYRLRATPLPEGGEPVDLYVVDGRLTRQPIEGAEPLAPEGGFVTSGLVECHGHISYPHEKSDAAGTLAWMNAHREAYGATGALLVRDMGAVDDRIVELGDAPGLPRVQAAGNMILPFDQWPFTCTRPEELVRACAERVERGARWVKVFADFTDDYRGRVDPGFAATDDVSYPLPLLTEAVEAVHALGGRVAAHCFTRGGTEVAVKAGVDSLEHGWGLDEAMVREIADRRIAWAPLTGIAGRMWRIARREGDPARVGWIEETMARLAELLPLAEERGVTLLAGTDIFPEVTVADEIRQLHELGVSREAAVAAGTWGARAWLGEPGLEEGAPADLVLYRHDPRASLEALFEPALILIGGERVGASFHHTRPVYVSWRERDGR